eukprot:TRINITY_DN562_c0_g1_i1.p1 TRINITY_DN562_c0_g1~~TRINITY_DN562_c0_g1_i1.p1  ORF type:complete len:310 (+),score=40.97 TRINITY_DN562_c0_g1_i1:42-971(+)
MFYDLCIEPDNTNKDALVETIDMAHKLGYDVIAVNHLVSGKLTNNEICKFSPVQLPNESLNQLRTSADSAKFKQLSRITIVLDEHTQFHNLISSNPVIRSYDLVAVRPTNEKLLHKCCEDLEIDIISIDFSSHLPFPFRTKTIGIALDRGIHFEITYFGALQDPAIRRSVINNASNLVRATKGRNIIISSGVKDAFSMRAPHDITNLATIFGLDMSKSRLSITDRCRAVIKHAETRKSVKGVVTLQSVGSVDELDGWKIQSSSKQSSVSSGDVMVVEQETKPKAEVNEGKKGKKRKRSQSTTTSSDQEQ